MRESRLWHPFADMGAVRSSELVLERGDDVWVWDTEGTRYLDATASLWYCNVGHGRPEIAAAVAEQMGKLEAYSAFGDFISPPAQQLSDRLAELAPMPDAKIFLASGGGDGVDTAAKLARRYWLEHGHSERQHIVVRSNGYHGTHGFGTSLAGIEANRSSWGPLIPDIGVVDHDDLDAMREHLDRIGGDRVAAVFCEPVIGAGGVRPPAPGYIEGLAELCADRGILFVCDSVICGFGRLGTWYGIERWDVQPDMIIFAKGVTSGYLPLGGVAIAGHVAEPFWGEAGGPVFRHGATYAGHATCCAAGLANLDLLEPILERGRTLEGPLADALRPFEDHPAVSEVRAGTGLLAALDVESPPAVVAAARKEGVLLRATASAVVMSPPLTITEEHFTLITSALETALEATTA